MQWNSRYGIDYCIGFLLVIFIFGLISFTELAYADVEVNSVTEDSGDASSFTHSHTVSGSETLLVVEVALDDGATDKDVINVTYDGTSLTRLTQTVMGLPSPAI